MIEPIGLLKKRKLTEMELQDIEQLVDICNHFENLCLQVYRDILQDRSDQEINDFLYYKDGRLVGCLCLDNWKLFDEKEMVLGAVHPDYRRQGIARVLLRAAAQECSSRGVQRIILVSEHISGAGKAFIEAVGGLYSFSEHHMQLRELREGKTFDERLFVRPANVDDLDALVAVQAGSFGRDARLVRLSILERLHRPDCCFYIATFGEANLGCEEPVGALRLDEMAEQIGIYAFGVLPDYRGRGYGRQMLEEVVRSLYANSQKMITLEVDVTNTRALKLYGSCGFQIKTTYDYFNLDVQSAVGRM